MIPVHKLPPLRVASNHSMQFPLSWQIQPEPKLSGKEGTRQG